jgi:hypothetical protein
MIAGINITGYQITPPTDEKNASARTELNTSNKMIKMFGSDGVAAGASFLKEITLENEVNHTRSGRQVYLLTCAGRS